MSVSKAAYAGLCCSELMDVAMEGELAGNREPFKQATLKLCLTCHIESLHELRAADSIAKHHHSACVYQARLFRQP